MKMSKNLSDLYDCIYEISDSFKSHRDAVKGFEGKPLGYRIIYSIDYVDSDLRNGGISQLYSNSTWSLILDAIAGAKELDFLELANALTEILFYYHQKDRSKMKKRINEELFAGICSEWSKDLGTLEHQYYAAFDSRNIDDTQEIWEPAIVEMPQLFKSS